MASRVFDSFDAGLLERLQERVPLEQRPWQEIARSLNAAEERVLDRVRQLKTGPKPVIRQISAIFDSASLGYQSTLVAARIDESRLEQAVAIINAHPGVSHNYQRNHDFNLWYTLAVPPDSRLGLERTVQILHHRSGALATRMMPTLKLFKIGVKLNLASDEPTAPAAAAPAGAFTQDEREQAASFKPTDADKRIIRVLQQDLPLVPRPFDHWAQQAGVDIRLLLETARTYQRQKCMRRFAAVLHHREAGFSANGMGVWVVPPDQIDAFGRAAAGFAAVSHCYLRPTYPDWPYNVFTMVHAQSEDACNAVLAEISTATGVKNYRPLYSSREFKKVRVQYFLGDINTWEADAVAEALT